MPRLGDGKHAALMPTVLLPLLLLSSPAPGAAEPDPPSVTASKTPDAARTLAIPMAQSAGALLAGGAALVGVLGAGAVAGMVASSVVLPLAPVFFPPSVRQGPAAPGANLLVASVVGMAALAPLAVVLAVLVDGVAWLALAHPLSLRGVLAALGGAALALALTLPTLVVTCVLMTLVTLAARWDADKLAVQPQRQWVVAALGWGLPILFLAAPLALSAAAVRGAVLGVVGPPAMAE